MNKDKKILIEKKKQIKHEIVYRFSYAEYKCNDYHLDSLIEESQYFIVSPKDIVVASLYENDDRIKWLIEHG